MDNPNNYEYNGKKWARNEGKWVVLDKEGRST
jgi:hypothetical protein